jgi:hypothetical protein
MRTVGASTMIALLTIAIAGCLRTDKVPASASPLTAADLARDPAVSTAYPGSTTLDGRAAGLLAEEVQAERDPGSQVRATQPGYAGQAYRTLVAPATRQQIISWYYQRLLHIGWRFEHGGGSLGETGGRDVIELLKPGGTVAVTTYSQIDGVGVDPIGPGPPRDLDLNRLLFTGARLTVYSVWLQACGRCVLVQPSDHPSAPRTIDLSAACPAPNPPVAVSLSGAATGSATHACGPLSPAKRANFGCDVIGQEWTNGPVYLKLVIAGQSVFWTPGTLRIAGPYTSDDRDWQVDPGPAARRPTIVGQAVHVHEQLLLYRGQAAGPAAIVDIAAPCTSFFF